MEDPNRCDLEMDLSQMNHHERPAGSWLCCLPCDWLQRNSGFHKMSLSVVTLLVTVLLVASPVLFLISSIPGEKPKLCSYEGTDCSERESESVCSTEECSKAGNRISSLMSWKANPCQDFYRFACGSWEEKRESPDQNLIQFATVQKQIDRNLQMLSLLEELGGYVAPKEDPPEDLTDLVLSLLRLNGAPLFDIYLDSDFDNSSELAPFIDLPLGLGSNSAFKYTKHRDQTYLQPEFFEKFLPEENSGLETNGVNKTYNVLKVSKEEKRLLVMEKIMRDFLPRNLSAEKKANEIQSTLHFASILSKLQARKTEILKNHQEETSAKMGVEEMEKKFPFIRWQYLLKKSLELKISSEDKVFVLTPGYLADLQRILLRFPFRVIHNGILLIFATDTLYELVNTSASRDWTAFCNRLAVKAFGKAVSILYVSQFEGEDVRALRSKVTYIFNALKKTFQKRMENMSWLDEKTRDAASQKLAALQIQILSWPHYSNASYAKSLMKDVQVDPEDFFGNVIQRYRQLRNVSKNVTSVQVEENRWTYPFVVNAFYVLALNTIIIPLTLLIQPHFQEDLPSYLPYSTLGLIIAHEILRGFDSRGIGYDAKGNVESLLSQDSKAKFEARLDCFFHQFSSSFWRRVRFLGTNVDTQFDWNRTKNENMADAGGLQMAYQAWKSVAKSDNEPFLPGINLNSHQLFLLNAAQTYCVMLSSVDYIFLAGIDFHILQSERVNGMMMNLPGFAEAYSCPLGSPMNPRKKCSTW